MLLALGPPLFLPVGVVRIWKLKAGLLLWEVLAGSLCRPEDAVCLGCFSVVTWLILPVVICLSQRLSHACLSINASIQWNCEWLIKSVIVYLMVPYYLDNRGNSRANTCVKSRLNWRDVFIRSKTNASLSGLGSLVIHDNCSNRMALCRRCFIQISALSTFDGMVVAYHGCNGWRRIRVRFRRGSLRNGYHI